MLIAEANHVVESLAAKLGKSDCRKYLREEFLPQCIGLIRQASQLAYDRTVAERIHPWILGAILWLHGPDVSDEGIVMVMMSRWDNGQPLAQECLMLASFKLNKLSHGADAVEVPDLPTLQRAVAA